MKRSRVILSLTVLAGLTLASCSKMAPLTEKSSDKVIESNANGAVEATAIMVGSGSSSDGGAITDPDHDEEHDKDDKVITAQN